jgi:putative alpha-1,2-mannosidase
MGEREQFNIMPSIGTPTDTTPLQRALSFSHDNEVARPDYYSVTFDNGIQTEIAPASHSAIFKVTFPSDADNGSIIFDSLINTEGNADFDFEDYHILKG